jgi:LysR family glycine cleavage system transcriptional activator
MRDLPLNLLRAFAAVYETGGVRPAARRLGIAHSAVSRHLHELEAWLGAPLLEPRKGKRTLAFSADGEALGRAALACLSQLDSAVASVREARRANAVTIDTTPSFAVRWLLPRLGAFEAAHRWIELSVIVDQHPKAPAEVGADIGIRMGRGPWPGVKCSPLMDDALYPVLNAAYWRSEGKPKRVADLARLRLLHDRDPNASWAAWKKAYGPETLDVRSGARFTSSDLVLRAAEQGLGVALARDRLARDSIAAGTLIAPFDGLVVTLPQAHWIIQSEAQPVRAATQAVLDWLMAEASTKDRRPG